MKLKEKFKIVIISVSLVPLLIIGSITYQSAKNALEKKIGQGFMSLAQETMDKIDRNIYERLQNINAWVSLGTMQDIMIEDEDGRIAADLKRLSSDYGVYHDIYVFDKKGNNIASSGQKMSSNYRDATWFKSAINGETEIQDVSHSELSSKISVTFSAPVRADYDRNKIIGALVSSFNWEKIREIIDSVEIGGMEQNESTYIALVNKEGKIISGPESVFGNDVILKEQMNSLESVNNALNGDSGYLIEQTNDDEKLVGYVPSKGYLSYKGLGWSLLVVQETEHAFADVAALKRKMLAGILVTLLAMIIIAMIVSSRMTAPITNMIKMISKISDIANGNLTVEMEYSGKDEIGHMIRAINDMTGNLRKIVEKIIGVSSTVARSSEEVSATATKISRGIDEQYQQIEQSATATTEVSQTIVEVAQNASDGAASARESLEIANEGKTIVQQSVSSMVSISTTIDDSSKTIEALGESSKQIGDIINVINDIAIQTNLLALNAAIEAARAGEQGRGFAVVADEVRKLAEKTGKATEEITEKIKKIQSDSELSVRSMEKNKSEAETGVQLAKQSSESLVKIVTATEKCLDMVQSIASAAEQQSTAIEEVSTGMESVTTGFADTSNAVVQINTSTNDLAKTTGDLKELVSWFSIDSTKQVNQSLTDTQNPSISKVNPDPA